MSKNKDIVRPFYEKALTVNQETDPASVLEKVLSEDFQSLGSSDSKSKSTLIGQVQYFWNLVPDLKWDIQDMIEEGDQVAVRSVATGSPKGDFLGLPTDGTKSFKILTIDIHKVKNGQISQVYHLEDWTAALGQLK